MKKLSLRLFVVYLGLLIWGVIIIIHSFSLVHQRRDAYLGKFDDTLTVGNRYFQIKQGNKQGFRGNVYADGGEIISTTIPIYDLYWEMDKVGVEPKDSAFFMARVDTLISVLCQLTPKVSREMYEQRIKEAYLDYYAKCRLASLKKGSKDKFVQEQGRRELADLKAAVRKKYEVIKISVDIHPDSWVRHTDWDRIRHLVGEKERKGVYYAGFRVDERYVHHNAYENYASSVIGMKREDNSYSGIEGYYDSLLAGESLKYRKLYVNRVLVPLRENRHIQVQNGCDITTTINIEMQRMVEQVLREKLEEIRPKWGCAILMETKTGAIKAISNLMMNKDGVYEDIADHAITESYEPGSTFKTVALLAALDTRRAEVTDTVACTKNRRLTVQRAFEISDNDGIYNVTHGVFKHIDQFLMKIDLMGLNTDLALETVNARYAPLDGKRLSDIDYNHVTHGYAVKLPPVYMLAFYNAIANNGCYMKPYLVQEVTYPNGERKVMRPVVVKAQIAHRDVIAKVQACLEGVVTHGTATRARDAYYLRMVKTDSTVRPLLAGKTGTARIYDAKSRQYAGYNNSTFVGYFPAENPQYTCLVLISGTSLDAGVVAAPVCLEIAEKIQSRDLSLQNYKYRESLWNKMPSVALGNVFDLYTLYTQMGYRFQQMPKNYWVSVSPVDGRDSLVNAHAKDDKNLYKYLKGASVKDAVYLLERRGYRVHIEGAGKVSDVAFKNDEAFLVLKNEAR